MTSDFESRLKKIKAKKEVADAAARQAQIKEEEKTNQDRMDAELADKAWTQSSHDLKKAMDQINSELAGSGLNIRADFDLNHLPAIARFKVRLQVNRNDIQTHLMVSVNRFGHMQIMWHGFGSAIPTKEASIKDAGVAWWQNVLADFLENAEY
jgi:hypothetical protein